MKLNKPSSYLITFNTLFGTYRWKRMLFGINSALEMEIEGQSGVEVSTDDFLLLFYVGLQKQP